MSDRKIVKYTLFCNTVPSELVSSINEYLMKDWQAYYGPFVVDQRIYQAMVKYEESKTYMTSGKSIICECGGSVIVNYSAILTSIPPQYSAKCECCDKIHYIECSKVDV